MTRKKSYPYNNAIQVLVDKYLDKSNNPIKSVNIDPKSIIPTLNIGALDYFIKSKLKLGERKDRTKVKRTIYRWIRNQEFKCRCRTICSPVFNEDSLKSAIIYYLHYLYYLEKNNIEDDQDDIGVDYKFVVWPSTIKNQILLPSQLILLKQDMDFFIKSLSFKKKWLEPYQYGMLDKDEHELGNMFVEWATNWIKRVKGKRSDYRFICHSIVDLEDLVDTIVNYLESLDYSKLHRNCRWMKNILDVRVYNEYIWKTALSNKIIDTNHLSILIESCKKKLPDLKKIYVTGESILDKQLAEDWTRRWVSLYLDNGIVRQLDDFGNRMYYPITTKEELADVMEFYIYRGVRIKELGKNNFMGKENKINRNYHFKTALMHGLIPDYTQLVNDLNRFIHDPKNCKEDQDSDLVADIELTTTWVQDYVRRC
jgi:hypothetical protein